MRSTQQNGVTAVFGKRKNTDEPAVPVVDWTDVREFTVSNVVKPVGPGRKRPVFGPRAVRVPTGAVQAPCAFCVPGLPASRSPEPSVTGIRLYEDEAAQRLLCFLDPAEEVDGERHHRVRDGQGAVLGTIRRIPPSKRPFKHTWRIDQPGHPEIVGRNQWATDDPKEFLGRGAEKVVFGVLESVFSFGAEGGDQPLKPRTLEWKAEGEPVMTSQGNESVTIKANWLDRRIAFAYALLGDR
jgi:hypothetical protein